MTLKLRAGDRALIVVFTLALIAGGAWAVWRSAAQPGGNRNAHDYIVVAQSKDGFRRADPLSGNTSYVIETPGTGHGPDANGSSNTIRIQNGSVTVEEANCSNQVCVQHDPIREPGEQIVCLPHGVVVEIVEREADATELR